METNKPLARAGYLVAALMVVIPLFDEISRLVPVQGGDAAWRFRFVGSIAGITLVPLTGLLVGLCCAVFAGGRLSRRIVGIVSAVLAVILVAMAVMFGIDYFHVLPLVNPRLQHVTSLATCVALAKLVLSIIMLALLALAGLGGAEPDAVPVRVAPRDDNRSPLIGVVRAPVARAE
jgi:hypothetical protein